MHASVIFNVNVLAQDIFCFFSPSGFLFIILVYNFLELPIEEKKLKVFSLHPIVQHSAIYILESFGLIQSIWISNRLTVIFPIN